MESGTKYVSSLNQAFRRHVTRPLSPTSHAMATRNAIGVVLPLAIAAIMGQPSVALIAGIGTLNVAMSDRPGLDVTKAPRMLWTVIGAATAVFLGSLVGANVPLTIVAAAILALLIGLLSAYGPGVLQSGTTMIIALLVASHRPHDLAGSFLAAGIVLAAGTVQTLLSLSAAPAPARNPDGHALARVFHQLGTFIRDPDTRGEVPAAMSITQATAMQQAFAVYRSPSDRAPLLLAINRLQSELMALADATSSLLEYQPELLEQWLGARRSIGISLDLIAELLVGRSSINDVDVAIRRARTELDHMGVSWRLGDNQAINSWRQMSDVLVARLESSTQLADQQREKRIGGVRISALFGAMRDRARATINLIRLNVRSHSPMMRHAIRLSVCVALAGTLAYAFDIPYWYWSPVAVVVVLRPYFGDTMHRMTGAWVGSLGGLALGTLLAVVLPREPWIEITIIGILIYLQRLYGASNIAFGMGMVAAYIVTLLSLAHVSPQEAFIDRLMNMGVGGVIAGLAFVLWPTWEHLRLRDLLSECVDRYRDAFRLGVPASIGDVALDLPLLTQRRTISRAARASCEEAIRRTQLEPDISASQRESLDALLGDLRIMVWSTLRMEAYLRIIRGQDIEPELLLSFREFCRSAEWALNQISAAIDDKTATVDVSTQVNESVIWMHEALAQFPSDSQEPQIVAWWGVIQQVEQHAAELARLQTSVTALASGPTEVASRVE